jgi:NAD(P)-dependent dehydrogenase (short-subunit alcohol dehydrogenase family)
VTRVGVSGRRTALVTGAGRGIGRATAELLASIGYHVAVNDLDASAAQQAAQAIAGVAVAGDVADSQSAALMVSAAEDELGGVELVVCNAGVSGARPIEDVTDEMWTRTLRVNLGGSFHIARAVVPSLKRRRRGSIVTVSSELALIGAAHLVHYVSAKSAILGFTRALARELAPWSVRVNCVAPGPVDTEMLGPRYRGVEYLESLPLRRLGTPIEIAEAIVFIGESQWTTGQVLSPNGGSVIQ